MLVRSENSYHVLNLPGRVRLIVGDLSERDCADFAAAVRAETPSRSESESGWQADAVAKEETQRDPAKLREIITRVVTDPDWHVRRVAPRLWFVCANRYSGNGDYTNAVGACRQAIRADPEDHQSYNLLSWIQGTCPDASVRDGKEAVLNARKACELTHWKLWSWIDTLAAAYAEAGDFKHAIKLETHALRTGRPNDSEQKEMQERLSLYKQSKPFRQRP